MFDRVEGRVVEGKKRKSRWILREGINKEKNLKEILSISSLSFTATAVNLSLAVWGNIAAAGVLIKPLLFSITKKASRPLSLNG